jgi:hypothetical protein
LIQQSVEFPRGRLARRDASQVAPCLLLIKPHDKCRIAQRSRLCQEFSNPVMVLRGFAGSCEQLLQSLTRFPAQGGKGVDYRKRALPIREVSTALVAPDVLRVVYELLGYAETRTEGCVCFDR